MAPGTMNVTLVSVFTDEVTPASRGGLLWLPYVLIALLFLLFLGANFWCYHRRHRERYLRKRDENRLKDGLQERRRITTLMRSHFQASFLNKPTSLRRQQARNNDARLKPYPGMSGSPDNNVGISASSNPVGASPDDVRVSSYPVVTSPDDVKRTSHRVMTSPDDVKVTSHPVTTSTDDVKGMSYPVITSHDEAKGASYPVMTSLDDVKGTSYPVMTSVYPVSLRMSPAQPVVLVSEDAKCSSGQCGACNEPANGEDDGSEDSCNE